MQMTAVPSSSHENIYRVEEPGCGLTGFIALHSTRLGPAAGGLRMRPYASEGAALEDVKRLSEGMTYKNAAAGLPLGGGKAVIMGDPSREKTEALLMAFGEAIEELGGRYWTAEDMGMTTADMATIARRTRFVAGLADGAFASGDPSPITARGILRAIRTACRHRFGTDDLSGRTVAVQGLGNVGMNLCELLHADGAELIVADKDTGRVERAAKNLDARACPAEEIIAAPCDVFAPCAIGGILNADTIPTIKAKVVAGGANNQLATREDATALHRRGILYAPDFVANGGGIINVATEILQIEDRQGYVAEKLDALDATMDAILTRAARDDVSPDAVAAEIVAQKIDRAAA